RVCSKIRGRFALLVPRTRLLSRPILLRLLDSYHHVLNLCLIWRNESNPGQHPSSQLRILQVVEDVSPFPSLKYYSIRPEDSKLLGNSGMSISQEFLEILYCELALTQLFDNPNPVRIGQYRKQSCEFRADHSSVGHKSDLLCKA